MSNHRENLRDALNPKAASPVIAKPEKCEGKNCQGRQLRLGEDGKSIRTRGNADLVIRLGDGTVLGWLCQRCYDDHLYAIGRGRFSKIQGDEPTLTLQAVRAYEPEVMPARQAEMLPVPKPRNAVHIAEVIQHLESDDIDRYADSWEASRAD